MDSKSKPDARLGGMGVPEALPGASTVQRVNRWLIGAVVVLAAALIAVGTWAIVDRPSEEAAQTTTQPGLPDAGAPTQIGLADAATVERFDDLLEVILTDAERGASSFTEDAVLEEHPDFFGNDLVVEGREDIARLFQSWIDDGDRVERVGPVIQWGNLVAYTWRGVGISADPRNNGILIAELTTDGKVRHSWNFRDWRG